MKTLYIILLASITSVISANAALLIDIREGKKDTELTFTITGSHTWATTQNNANIIFDLQVDYDIFEVALDIGGPRSLISSDLMISIDGGAGILLKTLQVDHDGNTGQINQDDFSIATENSTTITNGETVVFSGSGTIETGVTDAISHVNAGSFVAPNGGGINIDVTRTVPEPSSSLLAVIGLVFTACRRKR